MILPGGEAARVPEWGRHRLTPRRFVIGFDIAVLVALLVGEWLGPAAIQVAYQGKGFWPISTVISGKADHPVSFVQV